jgi:glycosyltransferase involved in cell wall biosynthesis
MRISIVIPNFNSGDTLERAIRSIIDQGYPDLQLIMADSASTDRSPAIIEKYRGYFSIVITDKDKGQADGLNRALRRADGDIVGWLCADDEQMPGCLEHVSELFRANPDVDVVIGGCERVFADGSRAETKADPETWDKITILNVIEQPSTFWRASLHRKLGELDTTYDLAFDWDLWCRMRAASAKLLTSDRILSRYYFSETNKSGNSGRKCAREMFRIIRRYGPLGGGLAHIFWLLYQHFDLKGCYDRPPTCSKLRSLTFIGVMLTLRTLFGTRLIYRYNWHFASLQERGLPWW